MFYISVFDMCLCIKRDYQVAVIKIGSQLFGEQVIADCNIETLH